MSLSDTLLNHSGGGSGFSSEEDTTASLEKITQFIQNEKRVKFVRSISVGSLPAQDPEDPVLQKTLSARASASGTPSPRLARSRSSFSTPLPLSTSGGASQRRASYGAEGRAKVSSPRLTTGFRGGGVSSQDEESSVDDETRKFLQREEEECKTLEIQAQFIKKSLEERKSVSVFDDDASFCVTAPSSGCSTPNRERRISADMTAKTLQDIQNMRTRLDYMTTQIQNVNNNYLSIQHELTELKKARSSCAGCF